MKEGTAVIFAKTRTTSSCLVRYVKCAVTDVVDANKVNAKVVAVKATVAISIQSTLPRLLDASNVLWQCERHQGA